MAQAFLKVVLKLVSSLVAILLSPIDSLINTFVPDLSRALNYVHNFFDLLDDFGSFAVSYLGLNANVLSTIIILYGATILIPLGVHVFKLIVKWWHYLVP